MHYYTIKNLRTNKYLYWNSNSDFIRQDASRNPYSYFYFTAGDNAATTDGVTSVKIHNLTTNALMASFNSWTNAGANWYVKAANTTNYTGIAISTSEDFKASWNSYDSENKIGSWGVDDGSIFEIEEVSESDITTATETIKNNLSSLADGTVVILNNMLHASDYVVANNNQVGRGTAKNTYTYEWTLKKQSNGNFKFYNAYTDKYIGSIPNADNALLPLVDADAAQEYTLATTDKVNYVTFKTTQTDISEDRAYLHMGEGGIVRWEATADASKFLILTNVSSEEAAWNATLLNKVHTGTAVGCHKSSISTYTDALRNASDNTTRVNAYKQLESAIVTEIIKPEANRYYTIKNATNTDIYLCEKYDEAGYFENTNAVYAQALAANNVPSLWQFESCTATGKTDLYYIKAANSGKYFSSVYWISNNNRYLSLVDKSNTECGAYDIFDKTHVNKENAVTLVYYKDDARSDRGTVRIENDQTEGKLHSWNAAVTGNNFIINEVSEIPVTISAVGVATLNLPFAVTIPEGVKAYTGTKNDSEITLTEITTGTIPAETPVILQGEGKTYQFAIAYGNTEASVTEGLKGTLAPVTIADDATAYVLKNGGQGIGMYKVDSTSDRTIGANKAYAGSATVDTNAPQMLSFNFGNITGIDSVSKAQNEQNTYYDLNGRRVLYPTHGIFVKGNGQKVYIK